MYIYIYMYVHMVLVGVYCMILNFAMFRVYSVTRSQAEEHVTILHSDHIPHLATTTELYLVASVSLILDVLECL